MSKRTLLGSTTFAHLMRPRQAAVPAPSSGARADDGDSDEMKQLRDQLAAAEQRAEEAEQRAEEAERQLAAASKKDPDDDEDDDTDEDGDEDSDREEAALPKGNRIRAARRRERSRCAAIFAHAAAGHNPALAAQLAFHGDLPRVAAVGILQAAAAGQPASRLDGRMAGQSIPKLAPAAPPPPADDDPKAAAESVLKVYRDLRGLKA